MAIVVIDFQIQWTLKINDFIINTSFKLYQNFFNFLLKLQTLSVHHQKYIRAQSSYTAIKYVKAYEVKDLFLTIENYFKQIKN